MNDKHVSSLGVAVGAGMLALLLSLAERDLHAPDGSDAVASFIGALPATAAGLPSSLPPAPARASRTEQMPRAYLGGTSATGRVAQVYIKVAEGVFLDIDRAPQHLRDSGERWVDVQFPVALADGSGAARAFLEGAEARVQAGDVVEIRFAHKDNSRFFPVKELTRVTALVANKDQTLARDMARRILAHNGSGTASPAWLASAADAAGTGASAGTAANYPSMRSELPREGR